MKILQVNVVYNTGSTGKIMCDMHTYLLNEKKDSVICYGRGNKTGDKNVYKTCGELYSKINNLWSRITGIMYGGCFFSTNKLFSIIEKEKPDVVHLHCLNGYFVNIYRLISWLKENNVKTVLTLHAEFMYTANCGYALECEKWQSGCGNCPRLRRETKSLFIDGTNRSWKKMKKAFEGFNNLTVVSVSPWLMERAKQSPILADKRHEVILNGIDTNIFRTYNNEELKKLHDIRGENVIFHATPHFSLDIDNIKGGYYILKLAELLRDCKFIIAGNYDSGINAPENVTFLGPVSNQKLLARYYSLADLTVIASKKETFSMICAESLCCGTPVVGFLAGGPETISIPEYSSFVEYGNVDELKNEADKFIASSFDSEKISKSAREKYSKEKMGEGYMNIYSYR